jgi:DNA-binding MarR family transcriptional regulator
MSNASASSRSLVNDAPLQASSAVAPNSDPPWHAAANAIARRFHQICFARTSQVVAKGGLAPLQFAVLIHLNRLTGRPGIDQSGLAERLNIDRNTTSVLVEQLATKGLVERLVNKNDRRARILSLTAKGERLYDRLQPENQAANDAVLSPLTSAEKELLIRLMIRVIEGNTLTAENGTSKSSGRQRSTRPVASPGEFHPGQKPSRNYRHKSSDIRKSSPAANRE